MPRIRSSTSRRAFLVGVAGVCARALAQADAAGVDVRASLQRLEQRIGGRLGVFALDCSTRQSIEHRADELFAMCSTFKWLLAAQLLDHVDRGQARLDESMTFSREDLLEYAPVTSSKIDRGWLTLGELAAASIVVSDNTAANLLLKRLGGPGALTHYVRKLGDTVTRLDRFEPELNENRAGDARDTTSPRAMASALRAALLGDALSPTSRRLLLGWLRSSETGYSRLRAGLPRSWQVGDKTGTGSNNAVNDVAIALPPGRKPVLLAVYMSEAQSPRSELESAQAEVARLVVASIERDA